MSLDDLQAVWLTLKLAGLVTLILMGLALPLAWWLAQNQTRWRAPVEALVTLPLVLPPTVLGFYLLMVLSPQSSVGQGLHALGLPQLAFSFEGLVLGSLCYSLPFAVQPLKAGFAQLGREPLEAAQLLGANRWQQFFRIVLPATRPALLTAATMSFAHTLGEFGVVLMLGGSVPGETRVLSIALYQQVEQGNLAAAHTLALGMLLFAFAAMWGVGHWGRKNTA